MGRHMIDMHSHVDLYPSPLKIAKLANEHNTFTLAVTTSPKAWQMTSRIFSRYENIAVALGLHPEIVQQKAGELDLFLNTIPDVKIIGEIGIDGSMRNINNLQLQNKIFQAILIEAEKCGGKVLSIHSRGAEEMVLQNLIKYSNYSRVILHWFSGETDELKTAISLGCFFSIGPAALLSRRGRDLAANIPIDRILPESDGPFAKCNGICVFPWEVSPFYQFYANIYQISQEQLSLQIDENFNRLMAF